MGTITVFLMLGLFIGFIHFLRSLRYRPMIDVMEATNNGNSKLLDRLQIRMNEHMGGFEFHSSEISQFLNGLFKILTLPLVLIKELLKHLIEKAEYVLNSAKMENLARKADSRGSKIEDTAFTVQEDSAITDGIFHREMLLAFFCLVAWVVFTIANYEILNIGLPIIWGVEKLVRVNLFGKVFFMSPIGILALLMILAEFLLGLFGFEFLNKRSRIVKYSKIGSSLCFAWLVVLALVEAALAIFRTIELRKGYYATSLDGSFAGVSATNYPFWAVGIISFIIPLIAAFAFDRTFRYLNFLWPEIAIALANIISFSLIILEAIAKGIRYALLLVLEMFAAPFRMIYDLFKKNKAEMQTEDTKEKHEPVSTDLIQKSNDKALSPVTVTYTDVTKEEEVVSK